MVIPTLDEIFTKLHPSAPTSLQETILLTGFLIGSVARFEDELARERQRVQALLKYVAHRWCAKNGLGGGGDPCTCGLDAVIAGVTK